VCWRNRVSRASSSSRFMDNGNNLCPNPAKKMCLLCGTSHASHYRMKPAGVLKKQVKTRTQKTPFVWSMVSTLLEPLEHDAAVVLCAPCSQWQGRVRGNDTVLLVDQLILNCLQTCKRPETRFVMQKGVFNRIANALREPGNPVAMCAPPLVPAILSRVAHRAEKPVIEIARVFWELHNRPKLLPNATIARAARLTRE
jgi:hypothetical protein